jgi:transcriptional regulator with XRE-family HTH domain
MPGPANIGDRVRDLRLSKRLSQAELAGRELSNSYISLIESGKRRPTPDVVRLLADRLGCTAEFLLEGIEPGQYAHLQVRLRHAELSLQAGDVPTAIEKFGQICADGDDPELIRRARWGLAHALESSGRFEEAIAALEELREQAEQEPASKPWLPVCVALCRCYSAVGDLSRAVELGEQALTRLDHFDLTHTSEAAELGAVLISAHHARGDLLRSRQIGHQLSADRAVGVDIASSDGYWPASRRALTEGLTGDALYLADRALATRTYEHERRTRARLQVTYARTQLSFISRQAGTVGSEGIVITANGALTAGGDGAARAGAINLGEQERAEAREALTSLRTAAPIFDGAEALSCQIDVAQAMVLLGESDEAVTTAERAAREFGARPDEPESDTEISRARMVIAQARLAAGQHAEAVHVLRTIGNHLATLPTTRTVARTWRKLGDLFGVAGERDAMTHAYHAALECTGVRPIARTAEVTADLASR